jgi:hypothetical protein
MVYRIKSRVKMVLLISLLTLLYLLVLNFRQHKHNSHLHKYLDQEPFNVRWLVDLSLSVLLLVI